VKRVRSPHSTSCSRTREENVKKDTAYSKYFIDSYLVMKKYAWFICLIPDEEICHDYLQSEKGVEQKLYSVVVGHRPNGTSCAQKAASYRLRDCCQRSFTMELGRTHFVQGRVREGEGRAAVTRKTDPFSAKSCWLSDHRLQKPQDSA